MSLDLPAEEALGAPPHVSGLSLHLPLNTVALRRGGLVTAVLRRASLLAASGRFAAVEIDVLGLQPRLERQVEQLREGGHLHPAVRVRSVLAALDPSGSAPSHHADASAMAAVPSGVLTPALGLPVLDPPPVRQLDAPDEPTEAPHEGPRHRSSVDRAHQTLRRLLPDRDDLVFVPDRLDPTVAFVVADGLPVARVTSAPASGPTSAENRPEVVELLTPAGHVRRVADLDTDGRLVHLEERTDDGTPATHRFFGQDGRCYLTVRQGEDGTWRDPVLRTHAGPLQQLAGTGELYRRAFERLLADEAQPVLFSEFRENLPNLPDRTLDDVVAAVRHPHLRTVAVGHSNHRRAPFGRDAGATPNWHRLLRGLDRWDALVLLTSAQRDDVLAEFGAAPSQVTVVPHPAPTTGAPATTEHDPDRIVLVARLHPKKRVDEAVRAMRRVVDARPSARLDVYGFGYGDDYERQVHDLVRSLDLTDHVRFRGFVPMADGTTPYDGACVTWLTSASEGFGLSLLESMGRSVPVVSFDTPYGPSELVENGRNGFLVPVGDVDGLAERTLEVMDNADLRERLALGSATTAARFDEQHTVDAWCRLLGSLHGPSPARATLAPSFEVESASWTGDGLRLGVGVPRDAVSAQLVVRVRSQDEARLLPVVNGWVEVGLPELAPGGIVDFSLSAEVVDWDVRDASVTRTHERRLVLPDVDLPAHPRWRLYRTRHGSFSAKATAPTSTRAESPPVSLPQRVARALSRRI